MKFAGFLIYILSNQKAIYALSFIILICLITNFSVFFIYKKYR